MEDLWGRREKIMKKRVYLKLIIKGVKGRGKQKNEAQMLLVLYICLGFELRRENGGGGRGKR